MHTEERRIKFGNNEMIITKNHSGHLISVKDKSGQDAASGRIKDLKLGIEPVKSRSLIDSIGDDTVMETHASPGCIWYFFGGNWYRICS